MDEKLQAIIILVIHVVQDHFAVKGVIIGILTQCINPFSMQGSNFSRVFYNLIKEFHIIPHFFKIIRRIRRNCIAYATYNLTFTQN